MTDNLVREQLIAHSWQRCKAAGLTHDSQPEIQRSSAGEMSAALDKNQTLLQTTQDKVLPYYDNLLANSNCLVMLSDSQGQVLNTWNKQRANLKSHNNMFTNGVHWQESLVGTNAIGTAIETGSIIQINHNEHYLLANRFMTGAAAPIFDTENRMLGVIDVSSDTYMPQAHTVGMVKLMSLAVSNQIILANYQPRYFSLWFNTSPENLNSQWSALVVFDETGEIIATNQRAKTVLGSELVLQSVEAIFQIDMQQLMAYGAAQTFPLSTHTRLNFYAKMNAPQGVRLMNNSAQEVIINPASNDNSASVLALDLPMTTEQKKAKNNNQLLALDFGDPVMAKAIKQATKMLNKDIPILINGETGVGKELFVSALHNSSQRANEQLVAVNCAAIPHDLVESELFGYVKGAFTGANNKGSVGLIRKANKGTLFLDEIGDMPVHIQTRMLRVLQERQVTPLGSTESYPVDFKLVAATHRNLKKDVEAGSFRQDLFYRISGLNIRLPALRERQDKAALIDHLVTTYGDDEYDSHVSTAVLKAFESHPWPGNIRQLINVIQVATAMAEDDAIDFEHLPDDFFDDLKFDIAALQANAQSDELTAEQQQSSQPRSDSIGEHATEEDWLVTYREHDENVSKTAKALGVSRNTLYKKLRDSGLK